MKIEYFESASGRWYFHIRARNGRIVLPSQGYARKANALHTINRLQQNGLRVQCIKEVSKFKK